MADIKWHFSHHNIAYAQRAPFQTLCILTCHSFMLWSKVAKQKRLYEKYLGNNKKYADIRLASTFYHQRTAKMYCVLESRTENREPRTDGLHMVLHVCLYK